MPRTKVSKSKRTRDAIAKDEKMRTFEKSLEDFQNTVDDRATQTMTNIEYMLEMIKSSAISAVLNMRFVDFQQMNLSQFRDYEAALSAECSKSRSEKKSQDDGYITEESGNSASSSAFNAVLGMTQRGRTPGPLSSAIARQNSRRSRSACNDRSVLAPKQTQAANHSSSRTSRNKLRTPMAARPKAISADRSIMSKKPKEPQSPPSAFLRWPKPGEYIMSVHGTPLNAPIAPDRYANVNIPIRDGVLSLRPKKLENIDPNLMQNLDPETLNQLKTLHQNLELIVKMSDRAAKNNNNK